MIIQSSYRDMDFGFSLSWLGVQLMSIVLPLGLSLFSLSFISVTCWFTTHTYLCVLSVWPSSTTTLCIHPSIRHICNCSGGQITGRQHGGSVQGHVFDWRDLIIHLWIVCETVGTTVQCKVYGWIISLKAVRDCWLDGWAVWTFSLWMLAIGSVV